LLNFTLWIFFPIQKNGGQDFFAKKRKFSISQLRGIFLDFHMNGGQANFLQFGFRGGKAGKFLGNFLWGSCWIFPSRDPWLGA
jgi:hypothetical protein